MRTALLIALLVVGACKKRVTPTGPALPEDALLSAMRARTVPDPVRARFNVKLRSKPLKIPAVSTGGGLVVDRPGKAYVAVFDPLNRPIFVAKSEGVGFAMENHHDKQWVFAEDAKAVLGKATEGAVELDDLVSLLLGLVPVDASTVRSRETVETGVRLVLDGPGGTTLTTVVDPALATPSSVIVDDAEGARVVTATYESFELYDDDVPDGPLLPSRVTIYVESVELTLDLRFKTWKALDAVPEVFGLVAPGGYEQLTLEEYAERSKSAAATEDP